MSKLYVSEKTNRGMLPQSPALESASADKPGVGTKRGAETVDNTTVAGIQQGRGETGNGRACPPQRHSDSPEQSGGDEVGSRKNPPNIGASRVFVLDKHGRPLMPCHPARARKLLSSGRARVHHLAPFVIRLVDREVKDSKVSGVEVGIDPGSRATGVSVFRSSKDGRVGLVSIELEHRGQRIHKKMQQRAGYRKGRRNRNLRYRAPRFNNRTKPKGWLAPSLQHRVDTTMSLVTKLRKWSPVTAIHQELVRFDMQQMQNPEISGVEYQQGELAGYEVREYLLAKFARTCVYCGAKDVPLNIDHIQPRSRGGSNRVSNLALACIACNQSKGNVELSVWLVSRFGATEAKKISTNVLARAKAPLRDAAAVNATRWALYRALKATKLPVRTGTGGRTKWNRHQFQVVKSHTLDAICVGQVNGVISYPSSVIVAKATGRGTYSRTISDKYGFPRITRPRTKYVKGFQTGDLVRAVVPTGKKAGIYVGRVAVRTSGNFNISAALGSVQGVGARYCMPLQRADGFNWLTKQEEGSNAA
ncbi:MAG: RNA-guided endonuclease IscB [Ferrimicrobium acidiphilum]